MPYMCLANVSTVYSISLDCLNKYTVSFTDGASFLLLIDYLRANYRLATTTPSYCPSRTVDGLDQHTSELITLCPLVVRHGSQTVAPFPSVVVVPPRPSCLFSVFSFQAREAARGQRGKQNGRGGDAEPRLPYLRAQAGRAGRTREGLLRGNRLLRTRQLFSAPRQRAVASKQDGWVHRGGHG